MVKRKVTNNEILSLSNLYKSGLSSWEIAKRFDTCHSNILYHLKKLGVIIRDKSSAAKEGVKAGRIIIKKNKIPADLKLNKDLAYILGVLAGDGYMDYSNKRMTYYIGLSATDKEFVERFKTVLFDFFKIKSTNEFRKSKKETWNNQYITRLCSKEVCGFINSFGNFCKDKWRVPDIIKNSENNIKCAFLKGFFDSEGEIDSKAKRIGATSMNLKGLEEIENLLKSIGIISTMIKKKDTRLNASQKYILRLQDRKSMELFYKNIGFTIQRKHIILAECIKNYKFTKTLSEELNILKKQVLELRNEGLSYTEIANKLNMSLSTVWNTCHNVPERQG